MTFVVLWEFEPRSDATTDFLRDYGSEGAWVALFRRSRDYVGSELLRDLDRPNHWVTIDRWTSREAYERFRAEHAAEYRAIDEACQRLTLHESIIGAFETP